MKPTKKQIEEVARIAKEMNFSEEKAINTLKNCSASIYKAIGAKGVVEASMKAQERMQGVNLDDCQIERATDKAILVDITNGEHQELKIWVPKSIIKNGLIPNWFIQKHV